LLVATGSSCVSAEKSQIAQVAALNGLKCEDCTNMVSGGLFAGEGLSPRYRFIGARSVLFDAWGYTDGYRILFGTSNKERADRLRNDLKSRLASSYKDLEYVEQLGPK